VLKHDPEKWEPVFGQDHAQAKSMIPKRNRFSEKGHAQAKSMIPKKWEPVFGQDHAQEKCTAGERTDTRAFKR